MSTDNMFHLLHTKNADKRPRRAWALLVLLLGVGFLGACGKKPGRVDPPLGTAAEEFPRTYPDPSTDPAP
ncbi:MAG: hypothetical protein HGA90_04895 [Alphaproteobacteria bacterium]|nr:hypothetical protein [Alphaproteobacteria bacterium]